MRGFLARVRRRMVRGLFGIDTPTLARDTAGTRRKLDQEVVAAEKARRDVEARVDAVADAVRDIREKLESLGDEIGEVASTVEATRSLVASARDDIPGQRRRLARARSADDYDLAYDDPDPLVTVRIASYENTELLIDRALASALAQTHRNVEVVIVNDGPDKRTRAAIERIADPRVTYLEFPFRSKYPESTVHRWYVAGAPGMNEAAQRASGRWIAPLDDDDEFSPDHVANLLALARAERAELVYGALDRLDVVDGTRDRIYAFPPERGGFSFVGAMYHAGLRFFEYDPESWQVDEPADWDLARRMLASGVRVASTEAVVGTVYRIRPQFKADSSSDSAREVGDAGA
jgi:hypothetical protein